MPTKILSPTLFVKNKVSGNNTFLNWHGEPEKEFHLYGRLSGKPPGLCSRTSS